MNSSTSAGLYPLQNAHGSGLESSSQFSLKKSLPIKKNDAEMLTRRDIQFDLLDAIFSDTTKVFTDQMPGNATKKISFSELYINALYQSHKCSKVLKDKMKETPAFAVELGKISLLANVGRINTTMAFFPEMRTALRTYHPVPSLQKTDGNLQDAPRIKNCLKAALLPSEQRKSPPASLADVLEKLRVGAKPPTSIVNLIFIMANQTTLLARSHFDPPLDFLDLFMPVNIPSSQRARAFLWLVYHYLEDPTSSSPASPSTNPFADDYSRAHPGKIPWLPRLSSEDMRRQGENEDPEEEVEWGNRMCAQRTSFLQRLVTTNEVEKKNKGAFTSQQVLELAPRRPRAPRQVYKGDDKEGFRHYAPQTAGCGSFPSVARNSPRPTPASEAAPPQPQPRHRTMFEHAFHIVSTTDPLAESDDEYDDQVRVDYGQRLRVLNRLRGRSPTPPPRRSVAERRNPVRNRWDPYSRARKRKIF
ncbi:hypothetical protein DFH11DRAFT_1619459 [Phellopilus nigrolimitatus]|nr:hypothetical protein DFH11DRAFT_1619459 [Phellopilus nigrolimitatus]